MKPWDVQKNKIAINLDKVDGNDKTILERVVTIGLRFRFSWDFMVFRYLVDYAESHGGYVLHIAAKYNRVNMLDYLIAIGLSIDASNSDGHTPLQVAVDSKSIRAAEFLWRLGADPTLHYPGGNKVYQVAPNYGERLGETSFQYAVRTSKLPSLTCDDVSSKIQITFLNSIYIVLFV